MFLSISMLNRTFFKDACVLFFFVFFLFILIYIEFTIKSQ